MRRTLVFACLLALTAAAPLALPALATEREPQRARVAQPERKLGAYLLARIRRDQRETWRWQRLMRKPLTRASNSAARSNSREYRRWVARLWRQRALRARRQAANPPRKRAWLCIHQHEGAWNDPNAPYYGGLQMDLEFQRAYGADLLRRKGTADNWKPIEQMWVAERAYRSGRGFTPWPRTARFCGLL